MDEYTRREMLRFLSKIKTLNNGCWEWTSTINRKGHPAKREPSGGESRVRLGAGLGNEAMQMTSL